MILSDKNYQPDPEMLFPGTYSRIYRNDLLQNRIHLSFGKNGNIQFSPKGIYQPEELKTLKYKLFGQVIRIHQDGISDNLAYYSFYYSNNMLYLCALTDDFEPRKSILNGSWRIEFPLNYSSDSQKHLKVVIS